LDYKGKNSLKIGEKDRHKLSNQIIGDLYAISPIPQLDFSKPLWQFIYIATKSLLVVFIAFIQDKISKHVTK